MLGAVRVRGLFLGALVFAGGCGGPSPPTVSSSTEEATVTGTVTINGKPATGGVITFDPSNINRRDARLRTAPIGPDGSYKVTTLVGENIITVREGPEVEKDPGLATARRPVDVKAGDNAIPVELP